MLRLCHVSAINPLKGKFILKILWKILDLDTLLLHGITVTDCYHAIFLGIEIIGHARSDICAAVSTLTCTVYNIVLSIHTGSGYMVYNDDGDTLTMQLTDKSTYTDYTIFDVMIKMLVQLSEDYPTYVSFC